MPSSPFPAVFPRLVSCLLGCALFLGEEVVAERTIRGDLPRRPHLGVQLAPDPDGIRIAGVIEGRAAEAAGIRADDVLLEVDGQALSQPGVLGQVMSAKREGDRVVFTIRRGNEELDVPLALGGLPYETSDEFDLLYDVVESGDNRLRSIITIPRDVEGPMPAVLFVQGLTCTSIENLQGALQPVKELVDGMARDGFVVMRCEKPGLGDSQGEPCQEIDFETEVRGFRDALRELKAYEFVDAENVFVFGHSMGGIVGPVVLGEEPAKGIAAYGTGIIPWAEYMLKINREQGRFDPSASRVELEASIYDMARFLHYAFVDELDVADIVAAHPDLEEIAQATFTDGTHMYTRHIDFFRQLHQLNAAEAWANVDAAVLALYGEYDFTTSAWAHEYIVEIVNQANPGTARFVEFPKLFHAFNRRASKEEAIAQPWGGEFETEVLTTTVAWMREVMAGS